MAAETTRETISSSLHPAPPRRVLIVLLGAIGDVVRALPLAGRIRRAWPDVHLTWAIEPKSKSVLDNHPWIDATIIYDRNRAPLSFVPFLVAIRRGRFDLVLDLQRHLKSGIVSRVSGAPDRFGFDRANVKEFNHRFSNRRIPAQPNMKLKLLQYQTFGDALGIPASPIEFGLRPSEGERAKAHALLQELPRPLLGVILGSSWPSRIYSPDSIATVVRELASPIDRSQSLFPILIGGGDDAALAAEVAAKLGTMPLLNLAGKTGLRDLVAIFGECAAAFGPDSGPMHIAAAVGCPVVSLWGSTAPERSSPWGFAEYAMRGEIPCHPCYLRRCPIGNECMYRITPAAVAAAVRRARAANSGSRVEAMRFDARNGGAPERPPAADRAPT